MDQGKPRPRSTCAAVRCRFRTAGRGAPQRDEAACAIDDFEVTRGGSLRSSSLVRRISSVTRLARLVVLVLALAAPFVWATIWIASPKDIARNKPARSSSVSYEHGYPRGPSNGRKDGRFGFHSRYEDSPCGLSSRAAPSHQNH